ncbi:MAG: DNA repair protein RecO [Candidatus Omnitrophota bacterium]
MAIQKTEAVLLKKKDLRETSLILVFFTRDFGKVPGILKGVRGSRPTSGANPLFFGLDHIVFYEKKKSGISIISQYETQEVFLNILKDWDRAASAYYLLELVDVFTEPGMKIEEIFDCLVTALRSLDNGKDVGSTIRFFEVKLLEGLGFWPGADSFKLTKGAASTLSCFERDSCRAASRIKLTADVGREIKKVTWKIIEDNLDRPLKTVRFLK